MSGGLGDLVVSMAGDIAKFESAMNRSVYLAEQSSRQIDKAMRFGTAAIGALGVGVSLAGLIDVSRQALKMADDMGTAAEKAGLTVERFSALAYAARQSDVPLEALQAGIRKLSQSMTEAAGGDARMQQLFRGLGVSVVDAKGKIKDVESVMLGLSKAFSAAEDGPAKMATAMALLGKSGGDLIPMLNKGTGEIARLKAEAIDLGKVIETETARAASQFNKDLEKLTGNGEKLARTLVTDLVPQLNNVVKAMTEASKESGLLTAAWVGLGGLGAMLFTDQTLSPAQKMKKDIEALDKAIRKMEHLDKAVGLAPEGIARLNALRDSLAKLRGELEKLGAPAASGGSDKGGKTPLPTPLDPAVLAAAAAEAKRYRDLDAKGWVEYIEATTKEYEEGLLADAKRLDEFRANEAKLLKMSEADWIKYIEALYDKWDKELTDMAGLTKSWTETSDEYWKGFVGGIESGFRDIWTQMIDGSISSWDKFTKSLASMFKRTVADFIYQLLAKPMILNVVAQLGNAVPGLGSLGSAAGSQLTSLGSMFGASGGLSLGSAISNISGGISTFTTMMGQGAGLIESFSAAAAGLGPSIAAIAGPVGIAIAAIVALNQAFGDAGENWTGQLGFGTSAQAYTSSSVFGAQGFHHLAGTDAVNRQIQAFMASTSSIDSVLAGSLSSAQIASIQAQLGGYNRRTDGQPAEFAFGSGDDTASAQLTLEFLKVKYGEIFDEIDTNFAAFVRGYTGRSEDLLKAIGDMAALVDALGNSEINGLNLDSLRAMAGPNGDLAQTFAAVTQNYSQLIDAFTSDAERLTAAQAMVNETFASLNMAVPESNEAFLALLRTIDFSDASSRQLWESLRRVAPAFQLVQSSVSNVTQAVTTMATAIDDAAKIAAAAANAYEEHMRRIEEATARREAARANLSTFMQGLLGNASLSTFSPGERLELARAEYEKMLTQAQGGNTQAIQGLQGSANAYLQLARELFASSPQYAKIFETVFNQIGGVAGKGAPKLEDALPTNGRLASQGDIQELTAAIRDYLTALGKGSQADISAQNDVLARLPVLIASNQAMTARR